MDYLLLHYENQNKGLLKVLKYFFIVSWNINITKFANIHNLKGKKIISISYYSEQKIMLLGRQNIMLTSEDQEEINLYNY